MGKAQPIKDKDNIQKLKKYFLEKNEVRNYVLVTLSLNVLIHLEQLLHLKWKDVCEDEENFRDYIQIEKGKERIHIPLNQEVKKALQLLKDDEKSCDRETYIFKSRVGDNQPIRRSAAYRILSNAAKAIGLNGMIGFQSMRKTLGYQAWKQGVPVGIIMSVYRHSSIEMTRDYLSIEEKEELVLPEVNV